MCQDWRILKEKQVASGRPMVPNCKRLIFLGEERQKNNVALEIRHRVLLQAS